MSVSSNKSSIGPKGLYAGTLTHSFGAGMFLLAMPFIVISLGGSDREVGLCMGFNFVAYMISCLIVGRFLDKCSPKKALLISALTVTFCSVGMLATIILNKKQIFPFDPVLMIILLFILSGSVTSLFWPTMMGLISTNHEGPSLSKRLAVFNVIWSIALAISPFVCGYLLEINLALSIAVTCSFFALSVLSITTIRAPQKTFSTDKVQPPIQDIINNDNIIFHKLSRIALPFAFIATALVRTQLALLFKENLGFTESDYGLAATWMSIAMVAVFFIASKTHRWHHKFSMLIAFQSLAVLAMLLIIIVKSIWFFYLATALIGLNSGFVYSSHQYYGVSGRKKRSALMATHEALLSIGFIVGSIAGGYIGEYFGRYLPYWFGAASITTGIIIQIALWSLLVSKKKPLST